MHFNPKTLCFDLLDSTRVVCHAEGEGDEREEPRNRPHKNQRLRCRFLFHFLVTFSFYPPSPNRLYHLLLVVVLKATTDVFFFS